jgi:enterochelin esterase-like enzyme
VPEVTDECVTWRLPDAAGDYAAVRLRPPLDLGYSAFHRNGQGWVLTRPRPPVCRLEYLIEVTHPGGGTETIPDPANPARVGGAFGAKSVLELPGYAPPWWLDTPALAGATRDLEVVSRPLRAPLKVTLWSPQDAPADEPLPLLAAHDGPEYDKFSGLTRYAGALIRAGRLPRHRVALLHPGPRDEWYSASALYARAVANEVLPAIAETVAVAGGVVGMGTSLGGLAMLHLQRRHPHALDGLFLQSSSFFIPRHDHMAAGFSRFGRIVRFVREVLRDEEFERPVPAALTCGACEENLENNRRVTAALRLQGYDAALHELADLHNYTAWRDAFDPHLTGVLSRTWGG